MKTWVNEKRMPYVQKIIEMKGGPQNADTVCPKCRTGRAIWRCLDCRNKKPVCVLCCQNAHKRDVFHRVEKWNGRYFQKGALWQVGIKLYLGHDGRPCPRSAAALTGLNEFQHVDKDDGADIIGQIATEMGISATDVMQTISEALDHPEGSIMLEKEREVINVAARKSGLSALELLQYMKSVVSKAAVRQAHGFKADSDRAAADVEVGVRGNDVDVVSNAGEEDGGGDEVVWEEETSRPDR